MTTQEVELRYASHSSLSRHRVCPQSWYYSSVRGLRKIEGDDAAAERDFGSFWHMLRAADAIERGRTWGSIRWVPGELTSTDGGPVVRTGTGEDLVQLVFGAAQEWWDKQSDAVHEVWDERIGEGLPARLATLYLRWGTQWAAEIAQERPLAVELKWERRLPALEQPGGRGMTDPKMMLVGYVDEVYLDTKRNLVVARDHKLHKRLGTQSAANDMMDSQLALYAWGAGPVVMAWGLGPIRATTYDRTRMVKPPAPVVTASGGLSKSTTDYDLTTYLEWAGGPDGQGVPWGEEGKYFASGPRKDQPKFGRYVADEKEIARLSSTAAVSAWFQRSGPTPLNANLVRTHLQAAVDSALDMQQTYARAKITHAAARNLSTSNCKWCDYAELCRSEMFGGAQGNFDPADFRLAAKERSGR